MSLCGRGNTHLVGYFRELVAHERSEDVLAYLVVRAYLVRSSRALACILSVTDVRIGLLD